MAFVIPGFYFLIGVCLGSFGSVLITRFARERRSIRGRSRCLGCMRVLRLWELIPVVSYMVLRGKCARCRKHIGILYPCPELFSGVLFVLAFIHDPQPIPSLLLGIALWLLLIIAITDVFEHAIPDIFSVTLAVVGLTLCAYTRQNPLGAIILGAGFFGVLWLLSRGTWIGSGDVILGGAIGTVLGDWRLMLACLFLTYVVGAVISSALLVTGRAHRKSAVAFGPFLALGTLMTILWRTRIIEGAAVYFGIY
ncbi:prepilin peptidase [Candidatus Peregrinibacteria bacterium]|nr:prepilin peptidase [Candidatus Peregrinibacteria bacterium]